MRLIDADALLEELKKTGRYFQAKFDIENAPTVEPYNKDETYIRGYDDGYKAALRDAKSGNKYFERYK